MSSALPDASRAGLRARRWDAVILGSGTAALMAAARLCEAGRQVLILEEDRTAQLFAGLREPFCLSGMLDGGVVDAAMRELKLALIDRRRLEPQEIAYQVVGPDCRLDVGRSERTADELVAWGLAKPEVARVLVRSLGEASSAERDALLEAPLVRTSRRVGLTRPRVGSHLRGIPAEVRAASPPLDGLFTAQVGAMSNLAGGEPSPEARARLLGAPLQGGALYDGPPPWLLGTLRRRVESLHGEFRTLGGPFELASAQGLAAVAVPRSGELWIGRALVIAAPAAALSRTLGSNAPGFLREPEAAVRRRSLHFRTPPDQIPEGMSRRVILLDDPDPSSPPAVPVGDIALSVFEADPRHQFVDLVARARVPSDADPTRVEAEIERRLRRLLPFAGERLVPCPFKPPTWDDEDCLEDPPPGDSWPGEFDLRVSARPLIYRLSRAPVAGLGVEGDLLLGWRGGDAIAAELR